MIQKGDGEFQKLYEQGRCPKCRSYVEIEPDKWVCPVCKMIHIGVENGNRKKPKDGVVDDK
jgi:Zn finger protein HypA/HybF involved in hydrogenase expression